MEKDTLTVELSLEDIAQHIGEQYILDRDVKDTALPYLAALSLEAYVDESYDTERALMEFIRNEDSLNLTRQQCNEIEEILR